MSEIKFEVSRNGQVTQLQETIHGNDIGDLIQALKTMKEASNNTLTKLLQEETTKNVRKAEEKYNDTDDSDGEEPAKEESRKKVKSNA